MNAREFSDAYKELYGKLYYWILSVTHNKAMAEDVVSRSFMDAWKHRGQLNGNFKPWLFQIAYNEAKNLLRRESYLQMEPIDDHLEMPDPMDFTEELARYGEQQRAARFARLLTKNLRQAMACHVRGLTLMESAQAMRVPPGTAGRRIYDAKQAMRKLCEV